MVIGLDVGDGRLIWEWAQQGFLPVCQALIADGTWGWLSTPAEVLHVSAWPSLYTGTLPGAHGVYYTFQPAPGQQGARRFGADQYGQPPFWQILSEADTACTVFDAPYSHPHGQFRGLQIFEWGTWAHYWRPMSTPTKIMRQLTKQCGAYPLGFEANQVGLGHLAPEDLQERLTRAAAAKATAVRWLMAQVPWELFVVVFGETHPAAHYCWPAATPSTAMSLTDASFRMLRRVYEAVDQAIGRILENLDEEVTVFLVSGDGVGPNYSGWHLLPELLQRLGYTVTPGAQSEVVAGPQQGQKKRDVLKAVRDLVPSDFRQAVARYLPTQLRDALMLRWATAGIEWSRTRAFCLPTDLEGCIRLNVKGREPEGIVAQGAEYEEVCDALTACLLQLINPQTGRPAVRHVVRTQDTFPGERRHYLPDLIVLWADEADILEVYSPEVGTLRAASPDARTGTHRPPGFVIARGPSVPRGYRMDGGHIVDVAPTVLAHFDLVPPQQMEGRIWHEILPG
jgi:predicted AlkP superfamily phosphohydrolase/phosphomutase